MKQRRVYLEQSKINRKQLHFIAQRPSGPIGSSSLNTFESMSAVFLRLQPSGVWCIDQYVEGEAQSLKHHTNESKTTPPLVLLVVNAK